MKRKFCFVLSLVLCCTMCITRVPAAADDTKGLTFESHYIPSTAARTYPLPLTYEAVITLPADTAERGGVIIGNYNGEKKPVFNMEIHGNGVPRLYINGKNADGDIVTYDVKFSQVNVATGRPVHLAVTLDRSAGQWLCYVDGQLKQAVTQAVPAQSRLTEAIRLGGDFRDGNRQYFKGTIHKVALYNDVRTTREIAGDAADSAMATGGLICGYDLSACTPGSEPTKIPSVSGADFDLTYEWIRELPAPEDYAYSFAVLGDIQTLTHSYPNRLNTLYKWIRDNAESRKIEFVIGLGDVTEKSTEKQYDLVNNAYQLIDGVVPFSIIRGNHDRQADYVQKITQELYGDEITGAYDNTMLNTYRVLQVGQVKYLFMNLDLLLKDEVLAWANQIIYEHADCHVIVSTHIYLTATGGHYALAGPSGVATKYGSDNAGQGLWDKLLSRHENIVMVLCGHVATDDIYCRLRKGANGHKVIEMLIDPQVTDMNYEGAGLVAMFYFSGDGRQLQVQYYSTAREAFFKENNQFTLTLDVPSGETEPADGQPDETAPHKAATPDGRSVIAAILISAGIALTGGALIAMLLIKRRG